MSHAESRRLIGGGVDSTMKCEEDVASERFGCLGLEEKNRKGRGIVFDVSRGGAKSRRLIGGGGSGFR